MLSNRHQIALVHLSRVVISHLKQQSRAWEYSLSILGRRCDLLSTCFACSWNKSHWVRPQPQLGCHQFRGLDQRRLYSRRRQQERPLDLHSQRQLARTPAGGSRRQRPHRERCPCGGDLRWGEFAIYRTGPGRSARQNRSQTQVSSWNARSLSPPPTPLTPRVMTPTARPPTASATTRR